MSGTFSLGRFFPNRQQQQSPQGVGNKQATPAQTPPVNNSSNDQNNAGNHNEPPANLWGDPPAGNDGNKGGNNNAGNGNNSNTNGNDGNNQNQNSGGGNAGGNPRDALMQYLKQNGIFGEGFTADELTKIAQGDVEALQSFNDRFQNQSANLYIRAMADAQKLFEQKIPEIVNAAVQQATGNFQTDKFIGKMTEALPFTSDQNIQPVAKAVASRLMKHGATEEQAIEGVKAFFESVADVVPSGNRNNGRPGSGPFGDFGGVRTQQPNWDALLNE